MPPCIRIAIVTLGLSIGGATGCERERVRLVPPAPKAAEVERGTTVVHENDLPAVDPAVPEAGPATALPEAGPETTPPAPPAEASGADVCSPADLPP